MFASIPRRRHAKRFWGCLFAGTISLAGLSLSGAHAATIMGAGVNLTCGGWIEARKTNNTPNRLAAEQWALGYLSGVAMFTNSSPLDRLDPGAVFVWLDNACQQHPLERLPAALVQFVKVRAEAAKAAPANEQPKPKQEAPQPKRR